LVTDFREFFRRRLSIVLKVREEDVFLQNACIGYFSPGLSEILFEIPIVVTVVGDWIFKKA